MNDRSTTTALQYLSGFGSYHETEAIPGALPQGQNSPQKVPFGLYAEQLSGSAFTAPRSANLRSWLYRLRPSAMHGPYEQVYEHGVEEMYQRVPSTDRIRAELGWEPTVDLDGILAEVIEHVGKAEQDAAAGRPREPRNRPQAAAVRRSQLQ